MLGLERSLKHDFENGGNRYAEIYYMNFLDNKSLDNDLMEILDKKWASEKFYHKKNYLLTVMCFDRWRIGSNDYENAKELGAE